LLDENLYTCSNFLLKPEQKIEVIDVVDVVVNSPAILLYEKNKGKEIIEEEKNEKPRIDSIWRP